MLSLSGPRTVVPLILQQRRHENLRTTKAIGNAGDADDERCMGDVHGQVRWSWRGEACEVEVRRMEYAYVYIVTKD